jgi:NAD(P)-dependent dehydrogenase (short-subunit alcohol dehydrogenase family)
VVVSGPRVALVTGAAGGIGSAVARRFATAGWHVVGTDLVAPAAGSGVATGVAADLSSVADCRRLVADTVAAAGRLDALVNAAGVWTEGPSEDTAEADWDRVLDVNLKGLFFVTAAAIPHLVATGGAVVNLSSDAGIQGNAGAAVYSASKGGVTNLTRALALELAPRGVRVNAVCPGDVDTPMLQGQATDFGAGDPRGYLDGLLAHYPQGPGRARFARPEEVAEVVWFLAQPQAAPVTGANWAVDFGLSAGI